MSRENKDVSFVYERCTDLCQIRDLPEAVCDSFTFLCYLLISYSNVFLSSTKQLIVDESTDVEKDE